VTDRPPRTRHRELPLGSELTRAALRLAARRWPSCQWIRGRIRFSAQAALPDARASGSFAPIQIGSDTSCHDLASVLAGTAITDFRDKSPRARRRTTQAPPAQGLRHLTVREEGQDPRTRGVFGSKGGSEEPAPVVHKLSPTCGVTGCGAFGIDVNSQRR
jgi:hypothetical protein